MSILAELAAYATYRVEQAEKQISLSDIKKMAEDMPKGKFEFENALSGK